MFTIVIICTIPWYPFSGVETTRHAVNMAVVGSGMLNEHDWNDTALHSVCSGRRLQGEDITCNSEIIWAQWSAVH
ncbi:MAG: hypothetical protein NVS2B7_30780 [Herpetosiphon sp.]